MRRDATRDEGLRELKAHERLNGIAFSGNRVPRPYSVRIRMMAEYKVELKEKRRSIALECHPDRNMDASDDVRAEKMARFQRLTRAIDFLLKIDPKPEKIQRRQPSPSRQRIAIFVNMGNGPVGIPNLRFDSSESTTTTNPGYWPWHG